MDWSAPDIVHEIQLTGGQGFDVVGVGIAGLPVVLIGHNRTVAWSATSGMGDNVDLYVETLDVLDTDRYWFGSTWQTMITRTETITVQGQTTPLTEIVRHTVHGPVIALDEVSGLAYSMQRAHWMREHTMLVAYLDLIRAGDLNSFQQALDQFEVSNNFLYADTVGNIAYWQAGAIPIRPDGNHVGRLPWSGSGSQEWTGQLRAVPHAVNPDQGFLVNWNNKASVDFDNGDAGNLGKQDRVSDIEELLSSMNSVSWEDMEAIPTQIAALKTLGDETRHLRPHLLGAIATEAPNDVQLQQVASRLAAWDGRFVSDVVAGTQVRPEEEIWATWLSCVLPDTFGDEFGSYWSKANLNTLLHALEGSESGVPPSRDYFDNVSTASVETDTQVVVLALRRALDILAVRYDSSDMDSWTRPRPTISFVHPLGLVLGQIPLSNRATYAQIIELSTPIQAANVLPLGQSGFISASGVPDPHFGDQLTLYRQFEHKPMRLVTLYTVYLPAILQVHPALSINTR
jgi:penicillin amidase